jgi:hypothetical protein
MASMVDFRMRIPEETHDFLGVMSQASDEDMQAIARNVLVAFHQKKRHEFEVMARILGAPTTSSRGSRAGVAAQ